MKFILVITRNWFYENDARQMEQKKMLEEYSVRLREKEARGIWEVMPGTTLEIQFMSDLKDLIKACGPVVIKNRGEEWEMEVYNGFLRHQGERREQLMSASAQKNGR